MPVVLAIESSCDETAVAVVACRAEGRADVLSSEVASQIDLHREYGGVVPELASRSHGLVLRPLVEKALREAGVRVGGLDAVAATSGPGLASSLLVGSTAAKGMACALGKPFLGVNHLEGHLLSPFLGMLEIPRHVALVVSGGHTLLLEVSGLGNYRRLGSTRDDAAGEAFDKVGKMLGLPYPGGPEIEKVARGGDPHAFAFPRSMLNESHDEFSFSGLKTAVLYQWRELPDAPVADVAASFQEAVVEILVGKTMKAVRRSGYGMVAVSGGVSLNQRLRHGFESAVARAGAHVRFAEPGLCTDNAAMIGYAALLRYLAGESSPLEQDVNPNLPLA
jgi:N6-L-threonylcarbamoyladenine synthase